MFVKRGEGGGKYTSRYDSFFHKCSLGLFLTAESMTSCLCSTPAFGNCSSPGESEEKTSNHRTVTLLMEERSPGGAAGGAQVLEGGHIQQPRTSQELLTFSHKQGGSRKGQG